MDRTTSVTIVAIILALAILGMVLGWRARQRRQSGLAQPLAVPETLGDVLFSTEALYAATTIANEPLNRVAVRGLGFRGRATVSVTATGVVLDIAGTRPVFIPAADIRSVERATWTIDRVVESGGLALIAWTLGGTDVDSYLRVAEPADPMPLISAIDSILSTRTLS